MKYTKNITIFALTMIFISMQASGMSTDEIRAILHQSLDHMSFDNQMSTLRNTLLYAVEMSQQIEQEGRNIAILQSLSALEPLHQVKQNVAIKDKQKALTGKQRRALNKAIKQQVK